MIKNILVIAYYFPPLGGAGVQRTLKFVKYLKEYGYNVTVLTVGDEFSTVKDNSLWEEIKDVPVYRAGVSEHKLVNSIINRKKVTHSTTQKMSNENCSSKLTNSFKKGIKKFLLKVYLYFFIPDDKISWKKNAVKVGKKIVTEKDIDIVFTTSAPYTSHLIGLDIVKKFNIPWICDFRDPWSMNPFVKYPYLIQKINSHLEKKVISKCNACLSVSQPIVEDFCEKYKDINKFKVITNGYDEADFSCFNFNKESSKFTITYNGTLYGKRSPTNFLKAVTNLINSNTINYNEIVINFIGQIGRDAENEIMYFNEKYSQIINCVQYVPHKDSIKYLENSSALLLIIESGKGSEGIFTGKIFEYIRSGRNIIGIVPKGVARDLINATNTGFCCNFDNTVEIEEAILSCYNIWKGKKQKNIINWDEVKKYERKNLSLELVKVIKEIEG